MMPEKRSQILLMCIENTVSFWMRRDIFPPKPQRTLGSQAAVTCGEIQPLFVQSNTCKADEKLP